MDDLNIKGLKISLKTIFEILPKKPEFPFKKLNFISKIGAGSYGTVLLAKIETEKKEEKEIAIKIISVKTNKKDNSDEKRIYKEINLAKNLNHKNIVYSFSSLNIELKKNLKLYFLFMEKSKYDFHKLLILLKNNCFRISNNTKDFDYINNLSELLIKFFIIQLIKIVFFFNSINFLHGDIKPSNILIFKNFVMKICDYSLTKPIPSKKKTMKIDFGTREYSSYECYLGEINIEQAGKSDIFSIGCILYNLQFQESIIKKNINDEYLINKENQKLKNDKKENDKKNKNKEKNDEKNKIKTMIEKGIKKEKECTFYSEEMKNYAIKLLNVYPEDRFNAKEAFDNKWLNEDNEKLKEINYNNEIEQNMKLLIELQTNFKGIDSLKRRTRFVID